MGPEKLEETSSVNSSNYAELKARMAERCGMHVQILRFSETVTQARLIRIIQGNLDLLQTLDFLNYVFWGFQCLCCCFEVSEGISILEIPTKAVCTSP